MCVVQCVHDMHMCVEVRGQLGGAVCHLLFVEVGSLVSAGLCMPGWLT